MRIIINAPAAPTERREMNMRTAVAAEEWVTGADSLVMNPRIEIGVKQIDQQVHENKSERYQQHQGLGHGVIAVGDRLDEQHADAVQVKHLLGDDQSADQK